MQIQIKVISVDITTKPTAKGSYQQATLAYRDLAQNQLKEKKILSFTAEGKLLFSTAAQAQKDQTYTVDMEKGEQFWEWKKMEQAVPDTVVATQGGSAGKQQANSFASGARTYETAEERAERQVLIVRQSSLSAAVATLAVGAKGLKPEDVLSLAERYSEFVFQKEAKNTMFTTDSFDDIPNDL